MKRLTQEEFDTLLIERVNLIAKSMDKLAALIEQRPDLVDNDRHHKTFAYLGRIKNSVQDRSEIAIRNAASAKTPFSFEMAIAETPFPPRPEITYPVDERAPEAPQRSAAPANGKRPVPQGRMVGSKEVVFGEPEIVKPQVDPDDRVDPVTKGINLGFLDSE